VKIVENLKACVVPVRFREANEREQKEFEQQLERLKEYYGDVAKFLHPVQAGDELPEADAIIFPQLIGAAYRYKDQLKSYDKPMVVLTSQFGTVEMWDWEIISFLRSEGMNVFSPYNIELAKVILRAIAVKKHLVGAKFLMFQDEPGEGMQANIFKRFYWWEQQCTEQMEKSFGIQIIYKSWKEVNQKAAEVDDASAKALFETWNVKTENLNDQYKLLPAKLYIAIKEVIDEAGGVDGIGANCLNESMHCQTTPCLVWNMLFEKEGIIWCCEGDTLTMLSTYILYQSLKQPIMMTNIYPFLVGKAACSHEKIDDFPEVDEPENHALGVHCGYAGFAPRSFCSKWKMVPKVLEIVDEKAYMIDCELPEGDIVLAKIMPTFDKITVIPAKLEKYVQFPGTDARNASLIYYQNGEGVMEELSSHHQMIITGKQKAKIEQIAKVFHWEAKIIQ
jgi:L-fucose isomerase and related proteins